MLGSYGLLGIFVYCEHKAGPPTPLHTPLFWVLVLLSVNHVKINGDLPTEDEEEEKDEEELSSALSQTQVTEQG